MLAARPSAAAAPAFVRSFTVGSQRTLPINWVSVCPLPPAVTAGSGCRCRTHVTCCSPPGVEAVWLSAQCAVRSGVGLWRPLLTHLSSPVLCCGAVWCGYYVFRVSVESRAFASSRSSLRGSSSGLASFTQSSRCVALWPCDCVCLFVCLCLCHSVSLCLCLSLCLSGFVSLSLPISLSMSLCVSLSPSLSPSPSLSLSLRLSLSLSLSLHRLESALAAASFTVAPCDSRRPARPAFPYPRRGPHRIRALVKGNRHSHPGPVRHHQRQRVCGGVSFPLFAVNLSPRAVSCLR